MWLARLSDAEIVAKSQDSKTKDSQHADTNGQNISSKIQLLTGKDELVYFACCQPAALIQSGRGDRPEEATATWSENQGANSCPMGIDKILG